MAERDCLLERDYCTVLILQSLQHLLSVGNLLTKGHVSMHAILEQIMTNLCIGMQYIVLICFNFQVAKVCSINKTDTTVA